MTRVSLPTLLAVAILPSLAGAQADRRLPESRADARRIAQRPLQPAGEESEEAAEGEQTSEQPPSDDRADEADHSTASDVEPAHFCDEFMPPYVESSARKLFRALGAHDFERDEVGLPGWVQFEVASGKGHRNVQFDVHPEKEGRVIGLVDGSRELRRTIVIAETDFGPVVVSQNWPARDSLESREDCRPTTSRIEYPKVAERRVAIEPFKYWGMRIAKRLPKDPSNRIADREDEGPSNVYELLKTLLAADDAKAEQAGTTEDETERETGPGDSSRNDDGRDPREQVERELERFEIE